MDRDLNREGESRVGVMRGVRDFLRDQTGAVTIEFVTLVPAFIFLAIFFMDASVLYLTRSEMHNVARDIARKMAVGRITTAEEARAYAAQHLFLGNRTYTVDVVDPRLNVDMTVRIMVNVGDAAISGAFFQTIVGRTMIATATVGKEPL